MNSEMVPVIKIINYYECNIDSIWISGILVILMILFILFLKIILYIEICKIRHICHPIPFLFGEITSCKQMIYSLTAEQLKAIEDARLKAEEDARLKAEEDARLKAIEDARLKAIEDARLKAIEDANKENKRRRQKREDEGCEYEEFSNQYNSPYYTPSYILAMYKNFIVNIENSIEKIKQILYILFHEYIYPTLYRITH